MMKKWKLSPLKMKILLNDDYSFNVKESDAGLQSDLLEEIEIGQTSQSKQKYSKEKTYLYFPIKI